MLWPVAIIVVSIVVIYKYILSRLELSKQSNTLKSIDGPEARSYLKDLYFLTAQKATPLNERFYPLVMALSHLYKEQGIFKLDFYWKNIVVICNASHLKSVLGSSRNVCKSSEYDYLYDWIGDGLLTTDSMNWLKSRSMIAKVFHICKLKQLAITINSTVDDYVDSLAASDAYNTKQTYRFTLNLISRSLLNTDINKQEQSAYLDSMEQIIKVFIVRCLTPILWPNLLFKLSPSGRVYHKYLSVVKRMTNQMVANRRRTNQMTSNQRATNQMDPSGQLTLLDCLLQKGLSQDKIAKETDTFLFAGHDTLAVTINWVLYFLGQHPQEEMRVRGEIESTLQNNKSSVIDYEQADSMVYLECFIKECLRLYPPVPLIARIVEQPIETPSYTIPRNTMIYILLEPIHRDESLFPMPNEFQPDRYLASNPPPFAYIPFSAGPRNCIGKRFAMFTFKVLICKIMLKYKIESVMRDPITMTYSVIQKPKEDLMIKLVPV